MNATSNGVLRNTTAKGVGTDGRHEFWRRVALLLYLDSQTHRIWNAHSRQTPGLISSSEQHMYGSFSYPLATSPTILKYTDTHMSDHSHRPVSSIIKHPSAPFFLRFRPLSRRLCAYSTPLRASSTFRAASPSLKPPLDRQMRLPSPSSNLSSWESQAQGQWWGKWTQASVSGQR